MVLAEKFSLFHKITRATFALVLVALILSIFYSPGQANAACTINNATAKDLTNFIYSPDTNDVSGDICGVNYVFQPIADGRYSTVVVNMNKVSTKLYFAKNLQDHSSATVSLEGGWSWDIRYTTQNDGVVKPPGYLDRATVTGRLVYTEGSKTFNNFSGVKIFINRNNGDKEYPIDVKTDGTYSTELVCGYVYTLKVNEELTPALLQMIQAAIPETKLISDKTYLTGSTNIDYLSEPCIGLSMDIDVSVSTTGSFEEAISRALVWIGGSLSFVMSKVSGWINQAILESGDIDNQVLRNTAKSVRNMTLSLLTLGLLLIAFANILNIQTDKYGLPRMIPKFVIGIVMSWLSYFICMFIISFAGALQALMLSFMGANDLKGLTLGFNRFTSVNPLANLVNSTELVVQSLLLVIIMIFFILVAVWLWLIMIVRKAMLMILVTVAPLAFFLNIMPFTETYYKKWWASFWKWLFIGPAVIFMLLLATKFLNAWYGTSFDAVMIDAANADDWIYLVIFAVFIFLAATIPLKMGNEIYGKIKDGWNKSSKLPWVGVPKRMVDSRIKNIERRRAAGDQMRIAKLSQKGTLGRLATGLTAREADARKMDLLKSMGELLPESKDGLATEIEKAKVGSLEEQAIVYKAITTGNLDDKSERMRDAVLTYADPTQEKFIPGLEKALPKENADFDVSAAMAGDPRYRDRALISLKKILPNEYKAKHWEYTPTDDTVITNAKGESIKISGLRSIALQKSQIDAGLKGKPEVREAFARRMYETGAHGLVQDIDQYNDIVTTAGHPELVRPKNTSEPAPPTPQPQSPQSVPDSINENRYTKRESGILIPREQNSGRTAQDGQSTNPQQPPTDTENPGSDGNSPT